MSGYDVYASLTATVHLFPQYLSGITNSLHPLPANALFLDAALFSLALVCDVCMWLQFMLKDVRAHCPQAVLDCFNPRRFIARSCRAYYP